ncbi:arabinan endo-1,5-alpha-L-arabinosidase [Clostridium beijerinckii]|uniref:arabinan endo-1,5-alpha-L-arabinosidase n=1 Tax=Clostridium beijerinckii TaxID=1520 RepID=UPI00047A8563|nr:arabinan endo-1,5-alpha-L-arabinosidase [Clostridium beijerinckii]
MKKHILVVTALLSVIGIIGCSSKQNNENILAKINFPENPKIEELRDSSIVLDKSNWGTLGAHDPSIYKDKDTYYVFSTDARVGGPATPGIQVRKSKDLINWEFIGQALKGIPEEAKKWSNAQGIWAPEVTKVGDQYYLYYCTSSFGKNRSYIGLFKSKSIEGPWEDQGLVLKTNQGEDRNALDPNIVYDKDGQMWMSYGSFWSGIYVVKLDKNTGKPLNLNDKGKNISKRDAAVSGAVEGPYIIYNEEQKKYYLFVSYGSLSSDYNVRVGRADNIEGPYLDSNGNDMTDISNSKPDEIGNKILGGYKFGDSEGWMAPGHNSILNDNGNYYIVHHVRTEKNKDWFYLNVRKILWSEDGWPIVSPERYTGEKEQAIEKNALIGNWQVILQDKNNNKIIPSEQYEFASNGKIKNEKQSGKWELDGDNNIYIELTNSNGEKIEYSGKVIPSWDWENKKQTIVFTAIDSNGISLWGKLMR